MKNRNTDLSGDPKNVPEFLGLVTAYFSGGSTLFSYTLRARLEIKS